MEKRSVKLLLVSVELLYSGLMKQIDSDVFYSKCCDLVTPGIISKSINQLKPNCLWLLEVIRALLKAQACIISIFFHKC